MIAIIDYDAGNIKSVEKALLHLGQEAAVTRDAEAILGADGVILPGVGAFGDAMEKLQAYGLVDVIHRCVESGKPFLGICLGLQLLFDSSEESPGAEGLHVLEGRILRIPASGGLKIPHIGWNNLSFPRKGRLFEGLEGNPYVYFVHSYYLKADRPEELAATTDYVVPIDAAAERGNVFATQFHPEKSGEVGLRILKNFIAL